MFYDEECFTEQSNDISISARSILIEEDSSLWGYYFCIENNSDQKISLVGKDWTITDNHGNIYNDSTAGFKGEIPELEPGEVFEFTDVAPIKSSAAVFYGSCKVMLKNMVKDIKMPSFAMDNHSMAKMYN